MSNFIAENIYFLRRQKAISQDRLASDFNKGSTTISNWENGKSEPSLEEIEILLNIFEVSADEFLFTDLSKGKVNVKTGDEKNGQKGKVKDKVLGKVNAEKGKYYQIGEETTSFEVNEPGHSNNLPIIMPRVITMDTTGEENAVFVPVRARAGYLLGYGDAEFISKLPVYKIVGDRNKSYRIFEVDGNSMFNTLHDKDTVDAYWVRLSEIRDGRIYVVLTRNDGILIKRVINRQSEGILVCKSDNNHKGEYPPIILNIHDVLEVWYVEKATSHNLAPPGEIYERMLQLEANVAILMHKLKPQ